MSDKKLTNRSVFIKNANPEFLLPENKKTLPFNTKLMKAVAGFTSRFDFAMHISFARSKGERRRMPPACRRKAIDALLQGICFHYDPLANRVNVSLTTLAIECGLATESEAGNLSITRATRALQFLETLGLLTYNTDFNATLGCNNPTDITFTPAFFDALQISPEAVNSVRESRAAWTNKQRIKQGLPALSIGELASMAWCAFRNRFYKYHLERKQHGEDRAKARRESNLKRSDIEARVKQEITKEISAGLFPASKDAVMAEVARRIKKRMILSRNYTRLVPA